MPTSPTIDTSSLDLVRAVTQFTLPCNTKSVSIALNPTTTSIVLDLYHPITLHPTYGRFAIYVQSPTQPDLIYRDRIIDSASSITLQHSSETRLLKNDPEIPFKPPSTRYILVLISGYDRSTPAGSTTKRAKTFRLSWDDWGGDLCGQDLNANTSFPFEIYMMESNENDNHQPDNNHSFDPTTATSPTETMIPNTTSDSTLDIPSPQQQPKLTRTITPTPGITTATRPRNKFAEPGINSNTNYAASPNQNAQPPNSHHNSSPSSPLHPPQSYIYPPSQLPSLSSFPSDTLLTPLSHLPQCIAMGYLINHCRFVQYKTQLEKETEKYNKHLKQLFHFDRLNGSNSPRPGDNANSFAFDNDIGEQSTNINLDSSQQHTHYPNPETLPTQFNSSSQLQPPTQIQLSSIHYDPQYSAILGKDSRKLDPYHTILWCPSINPGDETTNNELYGGDANYSKLETNIEKGTEPNAKTNKQTALDSTTQDLLIFQSLHRFLSHDYSLKYASNWAPPVLSTPSPPSQQLDWTTNQAQKKLLTHLGRSHSGISGLTGSSNAGMGSGIGGQGSSGDSLIDFDYILMSELTFRYDTSSSNRKPPVFGGTEHNLPRDYTDETCISDNCIQNGLNSSPDFEPYDDSFARDDRKPTPIGDHNQSTHSSSPTTRLLPSKSTDSHSSTTSHSLPTKRPTPYVNINSNSGIALVMQDQRVDVQQDKIDSENNKINGKFFSFDVELHDGDEIRRKNPERDGDDGSLGDTGGELLDGVNKNENCEVGVKTKKGPKNAQKSKKDMIGEAKFPNAHHDQVTDKSQPIVDGESDTFAPSNDKIDAQENIPQTTTSNPPSHLQAVDEPMIQDGDDDDTAEQGGEQGGAKKKKNRRGGRGRGGAKKKNEVSPDENDGEATTIKDIVSDGKDDENAIDKAQALGEKRDTPIPNDDVSSSSNLIPVSDDSVRDVALPTQFDETQTEIPIQDLKLPIVPKSQTSPKGQKPAPTSTNIPTSTIASEPSPVQINSPTDMTLITRKKQTPGTTSNQTNKQNVSKPDTNTQQNDKTNNQPAVLQPPTRKILFKAQSTLFPATSLSLSTQHGLTQPSSHSHFISSFGYQKPITTPINPNKPFFQLLDFALDQGQINHISAILPTITYTSSPSVTSSSTITIEDQLQQPGTGDNVLTQELVVSQPPQLAQVSRNNASLSPSFYPNCRFCAYKQINHSAQAFQPTPLLSTQPTTTTTLSAPSEQLPQEFLLELKKMCPFHTISTLYYALSSNDHSTLMSLSTQSPMVHGPTPLLDVALYHNTVNLHPFSLQSSLHCGDFPAVQSQSQTLHQYGGPFANFHKFASLFFQTLLNNHQSQPQTQPSNQINSSTSFTSSLSRRYVASPLLVNIISSFKPPPHPLSRVPLATSKHPFLQHSHQNTSKADKTKAKLSSHIMSTGIDRSSVKINPYLTQQQIEDLPLQRKICHLIRLKADFGSTPLPPSATNADLVVNDTDGSDKSKGKNGKQKQQRGNNNNNNKQNTPHADPPPQSQQHQPIPLTSLTKHHSLAQQITLVLSHTLSQPLKQPHIFTLLLPSLPNKEFMEWYRSLIVTLPPFISIHLVLLDMSPDPHRDPIAFKQIGPLLLDFDQQSADLSSPLPVQITNTNNNVGTFDHFDQKSKPNTVSLLHDLTMDTSFPLPLDQITSSIQGQIGTPNSNPTTPQSIGNVVADVIPNNTSTSRPNSSSTNHPTSHNTPSRKGSASGSKNAGDSGQKPANPTQSDQRKSEYLTDLTSIYTTPTIPLLHIQLQTPPSPPPVIVPPPAAPVIVHHQYVLQGRSMKVATVVVDSPSSVDNTTFGQTSSSATQINGSPTKLTNVPNLGQSIPPQSPIQGITILNAHGVPIMQSSTALLPAWLQMSEDKITLVKCDVNTKNENGDLILTNKVTAGDSRSKLPNLNEDPSHNNFTSPIPSSQLNNNTQSISEALMRALLPSHDMAYLNLGHDLNQLEKIDFAEFSTSVFFLPHLQTLLDLGIITLSSPIYNYTKDEIEIVGMETVRGFESRNCQDSCRDSNPMISNSGQIDSPSVLLPLPLQSTPSQTENVLNQSVNTTPAVLTTHPTLAPTSSNNSGLVYNPPFPHPQNIFTPNKMPYKLVSTASTRIPPPPQLRRVFLEKNPQHFTSFSHIDQLHHLPICIPFVLTNTPYYGLLFPVRVSKSNVIFTVLTNRHTTQFMKSLLQFYPELRPTTMTPTPLSSPTQPSAAVNVPGQHLSHPQPEKSTLDLLLLHYHRHPHSHHDQTPLFDLSSDQGNTIPYRIHARIISIFTQIWTKVHFNAPHVNLRTHIANAQQIQTLTSPFYGQDLAIMGSSVEDEEVVVSRNVNHQKIASGNNNTNKQKQQHFSTQATQQQSISLPKSSSCSQLSPILDSSTTGGAVSGCGDDLYPIYIVFPSILFYLQDDFFNHLYTTLIVSHIRCVSAHYYYLNTIMTGIARMTSMNHQSKSNFLHSANPLLQSPYLSDDIAGLSLNTNPLFAPGNNPMNALSHSDLHSVEDTTSNPKNTDHVDSTSLPRPMSIPTPRQLIWTDLKTNLIQGWLQNRFVQLHSLQFRPRIFEQFLTLLKESILMEEIELWSFGGMFPDSEIPNDKQLNELNDEKGTQDSHAETSQHQIPTVHTNDSSGNPHAFQADTVNIGPIRDTLEQETWIFTNFLLKTASFLIETALKDSIELNSEHIIITPPDSFLTKVERDMKIDHTDPSLSHSNQHVTNLQTPSKQPRYPTTQPSTKPDLQSFDSRDKTPETYHHARSHSSSSLTSVSSPSNNSAIAPISTRPPCAKTICIIPHDPIIDQRKAIVFHNFTLSREDDFVFNINPIFGQNSVNNFNTSSPYTDYSLHSSAIGQGDGFQSHTNSANITKIHHNPHSLINPEQRELSQIYKYDGYDGGFVTNDTSVLMRMPMQPEKIYTKHQWESEHPPKRTLTYHLPLPPLDRIRQMNRFQLHLGVLFHDWSSVVAYWGEEIVKVVAAVCCPVSRKSLVTTVIGSLKDQNQVSKDGGGGGGGGGNTSSDSGSEPASPRNDAEEESSDQNRSFFGKNNVATQPHKIPYLDPWQIFLNQFSYYYIDHHGSLPDFYYNALVTPREWLTQAGGVTMHQDLLSTSFWHMFWQNRLQTEIEVALSIAQFQHEMQAQLQFQDEQRRSLQEHTVSQQKQLEQNTNTSVVDIAPSPTESELSNINTELQRSNSKPTEDIQYQTQQLDQPNQLPIETSKESSSPPSSQMPLPNDKDGSQCDITTIEVDTAQLQPQRKQQPAHKNNNKNSTKTTTNSQIQCKTPQIQTNNDSLDTPKTNNTSEAVDLCTGEYDDGDPDNDQKADVNNDQNGSVEPHDQQQTTAKRTKTRRSVRRPKQTMTKHLPTHYVFHLKPPNPLFSSLPASPMGQTRAFKLTRQTKELNLQVSSISPYLKDLYTYIILAPKTHDGHSPALATYSTPDSTFLQSNVQFTDQIIDHNRARQYALRYNPLDLVDFHHTVRPSKTKPLPPDRFKNVNGNGPNVMNHGNRNRDKGASPGIRSGTGPNHHSNNRITNGGGLVTSTPSELVFINVTDNINSNNQHLLPSSSPISPTSIDIYPPMATPDQDQDGNSRNARRNSQSTALQTTQPKQNQLNPIFHPVMPRTPVWVLSIISFLYFLLAFSLLLPLLNLTHFILDAMGIPNVEVVLAPPSSTFLAMFLIFFASPKILLKSEKWVENPTMFIGTVGLCLLVALLLGNYRDFEKQVQERAKALAYQQYQLDSWQSSMNSLSDGSGPVNGLGFGSGNWMWSGGSSTTEPFKNRFKSLGFGGGNGNNDGNQNPNWKDDTMLDVLGDAVRNTVSFGKKVKETTIEKIQTTFDYFSPPLDKNNNKYHSGSNNVGNGDHHRDGEPYHSYDFDSIPTSYYDLDLLPKARRPQPTPLVFTEQEMGYTPVVMYAEYEEDFDADKF